MEKELAGAEVSCKAVLVLLQDLKQRGADPEEFLFQVPYDLEYLTDQSQRISWQALAQLMDNVSYRVGITDEELVQIGRKFVQTPLYSTLSLIARMLFTLPEFYVWMNSSQEDSPARQAVSCVTINTSYDETYNFSISMTVDDGYREIPQFYLVSLGMIQVLPECYGVPRTQVRMQRVTRGCIYQFQSKKVGGWFSGLRRLLSAPFNSHRAARQLRTAQMELHQKNVQLAQENLRLKQYQNELHRAKENAEAASLTKTEFMHKMSHEIRTPMNGILGASELLLNKPLMDEPRELTQIIHDSTKSLLDMLNDILDLAKIESGTTDLEPGPVQPRQILNQVCNLFQPMALKKNLNLYLIDGQSTDQWLILDQKRLWQILVNLVSNAVKFTEQGAVTIYGELAGDTLHIEITDTGIGIAPEDQSKIFEAFAQVSLRGKKRSPLAPSGRTYETAQGAGLGLSIAKELLSLMDGGLTLDSEEHQGTRINLYLPAVRTQAPDSAIEEIADDAPEDSLKILVVEDNQVNQIVLKKQLEALGHQTELAQDGQEGVTKALNGEFDIVLMDVMMPVMDGLEATEAIRQHYSKTQLPIIAISANINPQDVAIYKEKGMDDCLAKPLRLHKLKKVLRRLSQTRQSRA